MRQFLQSGEPGTEGIRPRVVRIASKRLIAPEGVGRGGRAPRAVAPAAQIGHVLIADSERGQRSGERLDIELGIGARARDRPHIRHHLDFGFAQQSPERGDRAGRVADGEYGHALIPVTRGPTAQQGRRDSSAVDDYRIDVD